MACLEIVCGTCNDVTFSNQPGSRCETCGSYDVTTFFDEDPEPYTEWDSELDDEEEGSE